MRIRIAYSVWAVANGEEQNNRKRNSETKERESEPRSHRKCSKTPKLPHSLITKVPVPENARGTRVQTPGVTGDDLDTYDYL